MKRWKDPKPQYTEDLRTLLTEHWMKLTQIEREITDLTTSKEVIEASCRSFQYRLQELGDPVSERPSFIKNTRHVLTFHPETGEFTQGKD